MRLRIKSTVMFRILIPILSGYTLETEKKAAQTEDSEVF